MCWRKGRIVECKEEFLYNFFFFGNILFLSDISAVWWSLLPGQTCFASFLLKKNLNTRFLSAVFILLFCFITLRVCFHPLSDSLISFANTHHIFMLACLPFEDF